MLSEIQVTEFIWLIMEIHGMQWTWTAANFSTPRVAV
jgi:hypothetical protein